MSPRDRRSVPPALARQLVELLPVPRSAHVLDPLVGDGVIARALRTRGVRAAGLDVSPQVAGARDCVTFVAADLRQFIPLIAPEWVIGVVPARQTDAWVRAALRVSSRHVALLVPFGWLARRGRLPASHGLPREPRSVWLVGEVPDLSGSWAWCWWDAAHEGVAELSWVEVDTGEGREVARG